jgi:hypothetical protein
MSLDINLKRNEFQAFPFHLVTPSPWPLFVSFSLLFLTIGAVMYMHGYPNGGLSLTMGLIVTIFGMSLWFKDVITEGTLLGDHTKEVKKGITLGVILFIVSEVFAFLSVFWAYFHSSLSPTIELGGIWPKQNNILYLILFILISLSCLFYFKFITTTPSLRVPRNKFSEPETSKMSYNNNNSPLCQTESHKRSQSVTNEKRMSSYKNANLNEVKLEFNKIQKEFNPNENPYNQKDFQQFINGLFQAEGTITTYFKETNSLRLGYYFAIGQNYTALAIFFSTAIGVEKKKAQRLKLRKFLFYYNII